MIFGNSQQQFTVTDGWCKKSIPPNTENSMQCGYDENDNSNMSNETKRETNYSTTKWNDVNTHNYMQLTKYNKYTNDDVYTDACVVHMIH